MGLDELGIALYDEVSGRTGGLDDELDVYDNRWNDISPGERRAVEGAAGTDLVELLDAYAEAVEAYNTIGDDLYGSNPEQDALVTGVLPERMVLSAPDEADVYLAAPGETEVDGDAIQFSSWLKQRYRKLLTADGHKNFERKLDQKAALGRGDNTAEENIYRAWDDAGIEWGLQLWSLLHVPELDVPGNIERRRELDTDIAAYAMELEERLDPKNGMLDANSDATTGFRAWVRRRLQR